MTLRLMETLVNDLSSEQTRRRLDSAHRIRDGQTKRLGNYIRIPRHV